MTRNVNELMKNLEIDSESESESESESISKMIENLEINSKQQSVDQKLNDAYNRYNYILENVEFTIETFFIENNIKTFIDHFLEYKIDTFLLYKFTENIDYQIELYLYQLYYKS
jgi:uncharacterized protein YjgD (DUF1641 family)